MVDVREQCDRGTVAVRDEARGGAVCLRSECDGGNTGKDELSHQPWRRVGQLGLAGESWSWQQRRTSKDQRLDRIGRHVADDSLRRGRDRSQQFDESQDGCRLERRHEQPDDGTGCLLRGLRWPAHRWRGHLGRQRITLGRLGLDLHAVLHRSGAEHRVVCDRRQHRELGDLPRQFLASGWRERDDV